MKTLLAIVALWLPLLVSAVELPANFKAGTFMPEFGPYADVDADFSIPAGTTFNVVFDVAQAANSGELNRTFTSAARFLNMHVADGVEAKNINLAIVVHGNALEDLLNNDAFQNKHAMDNTNDALVRALLTRGVRIIVCGQSAAYLGIGNKDFIEGVEVALSAMTAHALLQQRGYTLNPF